MSNLFEGYLIDTESPAVYKECFKKKNEKGYSIGLITDKFGNKYHGRHEVIMAESLGVPKHLWPKDEFGRRYVVDHIIPLSNGGTDAASNLRLVTLVDNITKNEFTIGNFKNRNFLKPIGVFDCNGNLIKVYHNKAEIEKDGFNYHTIRRGILRNGIDRSGLQFKRIES